MGELALYQGAWLRSLVIKRVVTFQNKFIASDNDILLTTFPKSGTNWTAALLYSIVNRRRFPDLRASPLQYTSPLTLVPILEVNFFSDRERLMSTPAPRIFATHLRYASLPGSIKSSACKMVYVWRNPMDVFVSFWHFQQQMKSPRDNVRQQPVEEEKCLPMDQCFELFCEGVVNYGPYWDHVLEFWRASLESPTKILFLKYEDMMEDPTSCVKMLAHFLGCPFSAEEEEQGAAVDHIVNFCSFQNLKNLEANKNGTMPHKMVEIPLTAFFRKGIVGDSSNYLTPAMVDHIIKITQEKWADSATYLSSGVPSLDFFYYVVPTQKPNSPSLSKRLLISWGSDSETTLKLTCNLRGVRGSGKSNKEGFFAVALRLHVSHPKTLACNVQFWAEFGCYKDLLELLYRLLEREDVRERRRREWNEKKQWAGTHDLGKKRIPPFHPKKNTKRRRIGRMTSGGSQVVRETKMANVLKRSKLDKEAKN